MNAWRRQIAFIKNQLPFKLKHWNYKCEDSQLQRNEVPEQGSENNQSWVSKCSLPDFVTNSFDMVVPKARNWLSAVGDTGQSHVPRYRPNSPDEHDFHSDLPLHLSESIKIIYYIKCHCSFLPNKYPDIYKQITLSSLVTSLPKQMHLVSSIFCYTVICQPQITFVASSGITTNSQP